MPRGVYKRKTKVKAVLARRKPNPFQVRLGLIGELTRLGYTYGATKTLNREDAKDMQAMLFFDCIEVINGLEIALAQARMQLTLALHGDKP